MIRAGIITAKNTLIDLMTDADAEVANTRLPFVASSSYSLLLLPEVARKQAIGSEQRIRKMSVACRSRAQ